MAVIKAVIYRCKDEEQDLYLAFPPKVSVHLQYGEENTKLHNSQVFNTTVLIGESCAREKVIPHMEYNNCQNVQVIVRSPGWLFT